jgi:hypothetical protein
MMSGKTITLLIGLMLSALVIIAVGTALAQTPSGAQVPAPQVPAPGLAGDNKQVEGTIQKVTGDTITLADGTELTLPRNLTFQRDELKPGASVKASYEEKSGQKMVTSIQVGPSR